MNGNITRRELVTAAIEHRETWRVPRLVTLTADGSERLQPAIAPQTPEQFLDNDIVRVAPPWWSWHGLGEEWSRTSPPPATPGVIGTGSYTEFFDRIKMLHDHSDRYILVIIYGSHFEKAYSARGIENFLADMASEPEFARRLLNRIIDQNMAMLENIVGSPEIDGILLGSDWGSQHGLLMSPAAWHDLIRPGEQKEYDLIHGHDKHVWIHSCGNIEPLIPALIEMGVDVLNPVQPECMSLTRLKAEYGTDLTFWGGLSTQKTLPYGTPDEVRRETKELLNMMSVGGGYIFSPAQDIQGDVPAENILAMVEAASPVISR